MAGTESGGDELRPALAVTVHDPEGRFDPWIQVFERLRHVYSSVSAAVTGTTSPRLATRLTDLGATVSVTAAGVPGESRRTAVRTALQARTEAVLYCDFDRWLHWAVSHEQELLDLPNRIASIEPSPDYVVLGRTERAFATHPQVQRESELITNIALSASMEVDLDAVAGACWMSRAGAEIVVATSTEQTAATDLEWPALVFRATGRPPCDLRLDGLEFETARFYPEEIAAAGGRETWERAVYGGPEAWDKRIRLAADSVAALNRVLGSRSG